MKNKKIFGKNPRTMEIVRNGDKNYSFLFKE